MVSLAITNNRKFESSDYEMKKPAPSYTLQTVRQFQNQYGPDVEIHWLIGADSIKDLPYWYQIEKLIDECCLSVMPRPGYDIPDFTEFDKLWGNARIEKLRRNVVKTPLINISSTEIRDRLAKGLDVKDMLHPAVAEYIRQHRLYQTPRS
jgi:nicotinate-nucleotide adenylyltransferase